MSRSELVVALERARRRTEDLLEPLSDEQLTRHWDPEHEWMDIGLRMRQAHTVAIHGLELDVAFEAGEPLRVEISSKFRREQVELEASQAGLRVESWWTDRAGDFAVALVLRDAAAGS